MSEHFIDDSLRRLDAKERECLLRSVVSSQKLSGVDISMEEASEILDEVLDEPLIEIEVS